MKQFYSGQCAVDSEPFVVAECVLSFEASTVDLELLRHFELRTKELGTVPRYSSRRTCTGLMLAARMAGTSEASAATKRMRATTLAYVMGSSAVTP